MTEKMDPCFVICPIGADGSETRRWSDDLFNHLVKPVAAEHNYEAKRIIDDTRPGDITVQIMKAIAESAMVVADLTGHNPNVFYELAAAHALAKPFILLRGDDKQVPFDVSQQNVISVRLGAFAEMDATRQQLSAHFKAVRDGKMNPENPFSRYQDRVRVEASGTPSERQMEMMAENLKSIEASLDGFARKEDIPSPLLHQYLT